MRQDVDNFMEIGWVVPADGSAQTETDTHTHTRSDFSPDTIPIHFVNKVTKYKIKKTLTNQMITEK